MKPKIERREFKRLTRKVNLSANLITPRKKKIPNDVPVTTRNLSQGGMMILWPKGWQCQQCSKCRFWFFNDSCSLRNGNNHQNNHKHTFRSRPLTPGTPLAIKSQNQNETMNAHVVWSKWNKVLSSYELGLCFSKPLETIPP